uniref:MIH/VIH2 preproprotein n=1 Tax=Chorismus antarcticus TaxID=442697 RepID=A0A1W5LU50_CHOAN|nr:MIH/VIH2 preproprotein [Chorismus antarcticus]
MVDQQGLSLKRFLYVAVMVALFGLQFVDQTSARFLDDECRGVMGNRDLYEKVARVCDDCVNIFRNSNVGPKCRTNCFYNEDFLWCVIATQRKNDLDQMNRSMSILRAGRK